MVMSEPAHLVGVEKQCLHCHCKDVMHFRYYNNGNRKQPRYLCDQCNRLFTYGGKARNKKSGPQSGTIKKKESKTMKSGKNLPRPKTREKVCCSSSSCAPAVEAAAQSDFAADANINLSQAKNIFFLRQVIYVMNVCPTCSTSYTAGMNAPGTEHYFGRIFYKSWYSCADCDHTFDVDLEWPTDDAISSSDQLAAEEAAALLLYEDGSKEVKPGSAIDEPANFLPPPVCGECSSRRTRFLASIKFWKNSTSHRCSKCL